MTREEAIENITEIKKCEAGVYAEALEMAIKALEQEPCEDAISRQQCIDAVYKILAQYVPKIYLYTLPLELEKAITNLPSVSMEKTGRCKNCKWWKDSDVVFRRGVRAESKCPINRKEVYEWNGYCFMFEPQESEE